MSERQVARATLVVGLLALTVLVVVLVPRDVVPGGPVTPAPVATVLSADEVERAETFSRWARTWSWSSLALSIVVACWFGLTARGRRLVERVPGPWWVQVPLAVAALVLLGRLVTLPCAVALQRLRLDSGLSRQAWTGFATDQLTTQGVAIVSTSVAVLVVVGSARRWPRAWPAVSGSLLAALVVLGSFAYPLLVEPALNDFEPLPDGPLRTQVLRLADEEGVHVDDVLVADASRRTTTLNAYVSGLGSTRRVVVYDNLLDSASRAETLSVVAHELAHARHRDVLTGTLLGAAGALAATGLLGLVLAAARRRGAPGPGEPGIVPLGLALVAVGSFLVLPLDNAVSRQLETRADVDAVRATGDPAPFVSLQRRLAVRSLADPTPPALSQLWFASHPGVLVRVAIADRVRAVPG
ncbi:M48 family metallopeptidase [Nocardioides rubriscoriae]|uniref:M48 family metallopeptidase n=1 Tax=Nocardioides rubriscoriae TaxID=642762 RepID=UPI0011DF93E7|nr:M48 family metallopeptidase [Nocardioides rubriscoriae]